MGNVHSVHWLDGGKERVLTLIVSKTGFTLKAFKPQFETTWDEVLSVESDGPGGLEKRITATRLLALGPFALAARKKTGEAYAFINFKDGDQMVLKFEKMSEPQVKAIFAPYRPLFAQPVAPAPAAPLPPPSAQTDVVDKLRQLAELRDAGVLTEDEFQTQKTKLLG
jgi:hypothetical protein